MHLAGFRLRFRTSLLAWSVGLSVLVVGASLLAISRPVERAARAQAVEHLVLARRAVLELLESRRALLSSQAHALAEDPRLKALVTATDPDPHTTLGTAVSLQGALAVDFVVLLDALGRVRADGLNPGGVGRELADDPLVAAVFTRGAGGGLWRDGDRVFRVQGHRIAAEGRTVGAVLIGARLDSAFVSQVERQTGSAVVLGYGGRVLAVSEDSGLTRGEPLQAVLEALPAGAVPAAVDLAGRPYLALGDVLHDGPSLLRIAVMRSLELELEPARRAVSGAALVAGAAVLLSLLLARWSSRLLCRPVDGLVALTRRVAAGDLDARAPLVGSLELVTLGESMNAMLDELRDSRRGLEEKQRLADELDIAARIHAGVLPRAPRAEGLEIAACVVPAADTGGDYYDVLPARGACWIGIGDVAGHGLHAGLIMLMVQSVVSALVRARPDASPREIVAVLNSVIWDNVRGRLQRREHVTLTLLRHAAGRLVYAGAHEDLVVLRAGATRCERLPTAGAWVGAIEDLASCTADRETAFGPGDLLVLYTDGVTEARAEGGECFGLDRLTAEIERLRAEPVEQVRREILAAVRAFAPRQIDDLTLLVIRHA